MERYPNADAHTAASLELEPENIQTLKLKGTLLQIKGDDQGAQEAFEQILSIDPDNYSFHLDLANIHFLRK